MDSKNLPTLVEELRFHIDESTLLIRADQIRTRLDAYPVMIVSQALLALALVWMMWGVVATHILSGWLALMLTGLALDGLFLFQHRAEVTTVEQCQRWARHFVIFVTLLGGLWGAAGVVMFVADNLGFQALLISVALGLAAGAVTINPIFVPALIIWEILVLTPITLRVFAEGDEIHLALGAMLLLYSITVLNDGYKLSRRLLEALLRGHENTALLKDLSHEQIISEQAREKAETANREKSRFLAAASHDLRQPLQALMLFSDALSSHIHGRDPIAQKLAGQIESSVNSLTDMLSALLNISRLESGVVQPQLQHFNLQHLLDRLYLEFHRIAQEQGLAFTIPVFSEQFDGVVIHSDPHLLEQIIRNLASNAIRYTTEGKVEVMCHLVGDKVKICVADTGIGISKEDLPRIFDEYFQSNNSQRDRRQGLGLGLSIVRRVEKLLGYHLVVKSELGRGTSICFTVPLGDADRETFPYRVLEEAEDIYATHVALLEDDAEIREATQALLESWGCIVFAAALPDELIAQYEKEKQRPDVLLSDYRLPAGVTAIHALKQMRELWGPSLPVIVVTGDTGSEALREIQSNQAILLHKPLSPVRLRAVIYQSVQGPR
ncbi:Histidine protein kinase DivJ [Ferriphaselus amnicola]|uniref:histidine kinase n=1 Tax=Ferriphaselus amnicola TaxID=1188319 RepID=A0A2Z6G826_9PROT|nr:hybrid sensor histidine kinase/response regulator [Ferriphaselus amnicola]BBE49612.1 Histidine protein kinase DivJ [Ferriphaselus amnicola]